MTDEDRQALDARHRENVIAFIKARDIRALQGEPITEEMVKLYWNRVLTPWNIVNGRPVPTPVQNFIPLETAHDEA